MDIPIIISITIALLSKAIHNIIPISNPKHKYVFPAASPPDIAHPYPCAKDTPKTGTNKNLSLYLSTIL